MLMKLLAGVAGVAVVEKASIDEAFLLCAAPAGELVLSSSARWPGAADALSADLNTACAWWQ
jgi:hypothetical protein